jgi:AcrR family transcriptional regulator
VAGQEEKNDYTGRQSQKNRTRRALVEAAESLMRSGGQPTVTATAEAAGISRATAYRYFPSQEMLWAEVALFASGGPLFSPLDQGGSVADAITRLVRNVGTWAYANQKPLRTLLQLSLDPSKGVQRPGHRVDWIADTLAPVRDQLDAETYNKLANALTLMIGIDPVVVMTDIAGASQEEALGALEWSARVLVEAALRTAS